MYFSLGNLLKMEYVHLFWLRPPTCRYEVRGAGLPIPQRGRTPTVGRRLPHHRCSRHTRPGCVRAQCAAAQARGRDAGGWMGGWVRRGAPPSLLAWTLLNSLLESERGRNVLEHPVLCVLRLA
jgi:hypothetical protein